MRELVALEGPPGPEFAVALQRCWDAGDAVLPVDHRLPEAARHALQINETNSGRRDKAKRRTRHR